MHVACKPEWERGSVGMWECGQTAGAKDWMHAACKPEREYGTVGVWAGGRCAGGLDACWPAIGKGSVGVSECRCATPGFTVMRQPGGADCMEDATLPPMPCRKAAPSRGAAVRQPQAEEQ
eukprot:73608-Chlamydomonas_euryale.AAC.1